MVKDDNMKNTRNIAIIALIIIIIIAGATLIAFQNDDSSNNKEENNESIFEVIDPHDDARTFTAENSEVGYGNEDGDWAYLQLAPSYSFGTRFQNVTIPKDAVIIDAYVALYCMGTPDHLHPNCFIYCDNVSNSQNFSKVVGVLNISGRNYTNNMVDWNRTVRYGYWYRTPPLTDIVKEVIDNKNWISGNPITVLFVSKGLRRYSTTFQNFENGYPPKLYIIWK
jgi:hypothetical protein